MEVIKPFANSFKKVLRTIIHLGNEEFCQAIEKFYSATNIKSDVQAIIESGTLDNPLGRFVASFTKGIEEFDIRDSRDRITEQSILDSLELNPKSHFIMLPDLDFHAAWYLMQPNERVVFTDGVQVMYLAGLQLCRICGTKLEEATVGRTNFKDSLESKGDIAKTVISHSVQLNESVREKDRAIRAGISAVDRVTKKMRDNQLENIELDIPSLAMEHEKVQDVTKGLQKHFTKEIANGNMHQSDLANIWTSVIKKAKEDAEASGNHSEFIKTIDVYLKEVERGMDMNKPEAQRLYSELASLRDPPKENRTREDVVKIYRNKLRAIRNSRTKK